MACGCCGADTSPPKDLGVPAYGYGHGYGLIIASALVSNDSPLLLKLKKVEGINSIPHKDKVFVFRILQEALLPALKKEKYNPKEGGYNSLSVEVSKDGVFRLCGALSATPGRLHEKIDGKEGVFVAIVPYVETDSWFSSCESSARAFRDFGFKMFAFSHRVHVAPRRMLFFVYSSEWGEK